MYMCCIENFDTFLLSSLLTFNEWDYLHGTDFHLFLFFEVLAYSIKLKPHNIFRKRVFFEREQNHNNLAFVLYSKLPEDEIDGLRNTYLRRTHKINRRGERHDAPKDALPHNLISVSSAW